MTDIQRWSHEHPTECVQVRYDFGDWVRYADHVEALRQAEQRGHERGMRTTGHYRVAYEQGQRDALAGAVQRVEALKATDLTNEAHIWGRAAVLSAVIAAIKGES